MARPDSTSKVRFTGPFFERDPRITFRQNVRAMIQGMADEGQAAVQAQLASHSKTGALSDSILGRTQALSGRQWALTGVISSRLSETMGRQSYAGYIETGRKSTDTMRLEYRVSKRGRVTKRRAYASAFRGVHMFRNVSSGLRSARAVAVADLTRGLE